MFENIRSDLEAQTGGKSFLSKTKHALISHSFHMTLLYRIGAWVQPLPILGAPIRIIVEYLIRVVFASDISCRAKIGKGLFIVHGHDVVIGGDVVIGKNCKILNGVTLGNKDTESAINQQPHIGDNVVIGTGAKILGKINIGDRVKIGANSVVLENVPSGCIAVGIPAKAKKLNEN